MRCSDWRSSSAFASRAKRLWCCTSKAESVRPTFDGAYGLGVCRSYLQNDEARGRAVRTGRARDPSAAVAWAGLGTSLVKLRRTAEGIAKLQRAVALEPGMSEAHYMLGMAYQASGDKHVPRRRSRRPSSCGPAMRRDR